MTGYKLYFHYKIRKVISYGKCDLIEIKDFLIDYSNTIICCDVLRLIIVLYFNLLTASVSG